MADDRFRVFLFVENCLLRESLTRILSKREDILVAGATCFSASAMQEASAANPDVVIFDSAKVALFGSCAIARMREAGLSAKIVMIGMEDDETIFLRAVEEGVMGYALQDATSAENTRVVRAVANGEAICPPRYSARLFECAARDISFSFNPSHRTQYGLTQREQQVVGLIRLGLSNKGIGARLSLSERTVKNHIHRILRKVGANDRLDIVARCKSEVPALTNHEFGERRYRDDRGINPQ